MSDLILIDWFDDELGIPGSPRLEIASAAERRLGQGVRLRARSTDDERMKRLVSDYEAGAADVPDLLLIDLKLNSTNEGISPPTWRSGRALAGMLSNEPPLVDVPLYLVSSAFSRKPQETLWEEGFDKVVRSDDLSRDAFEKMLSDARDYRKVTTLLSNWNDIDLTEEKLRGVRELLAAPESCEVELDSLLTHHLARILRSKRERATAAAGFASPSLKLPLTRFIRQELLFRNGSLVSTEMLCVMLGVKRKFFDEKLSNRLLPKLEASQYNGIFGGDWRPRWWKSAVIDKVTQELNVKYVSAREQFSQMVSTVLEVPDESQAACAKCGLKWPQTIAKYSDDRDEWDPVHFYCAEPLEGTSMFGFEDLREYSE